MQCSVFTFVCCDEDSKIDICVVLQCAISQSEKSKSREYYGNQSDRKYHGNLVLGYMKITVAHSKFVNAFTINSEALRAPLIMLKIWCISHIKGKIRLPRG